MTNATNVESTDSNTPPQPFNHMEIVHNQNARHRYSNRYFLSKMRKVVWLIFGSLNLLLTARFFLKMFNISADSSLVNFIYNTSYLFIKPLQTIMVAPKIGGLTFEVNTLLAIMVYLLTGWLIARLFTYEPGNLVIVKHD